MAQLTNNSLATPLGAGLTQLLLAPDIQPGDAPSYQLCKTIYTQHPLGGKIVEAPIEAAQSQQREVTVPGAPDRVVQQFLGQWEADNADRVIYSTAVVSRIYGIGSVAMLVEGKKPSDEVDFRKLGDATVAFNVLDPLNTAGSLVLNQDPNAMDFMKFAAIGVNGVAYARSRTCTLLNEDPVYLAYTQSAFGFVGRSSYQRSLFPLKSFVQSMVTDDMVSRKAGLLVAKMKGAGSITDRVMAAISGVKRALLQVGSTNNILSIEIDESIDSINLQNIDGPQTVSRKNILENIASATPMPAKLLLQETFAEGFGEGTEDAKYVARYVDRTRVKLRPLYAFFDKIVMHRAWNDRFIETVRREFPEDYGGKTNEEIFFSWANAFTALWPSLLKEPESEEIKVDDVKLKAVIALLEVLMSQLDPENKATLIQWAADNVNENKLLFRDPLVLDYEKLESFKPEVPAKEVDPEAPFSTHDSARHDRVRHALTELDAAIGALPSRARLQKAA